MLSKKGDFFDSVDPKAVMLDAGSTRSISGPFGVDRTMLASAIFDANDRNRTLPAINWRNARCSFAPTLATSETRLEKGFADR